MAGMTEAGMNKLQGFGYTGSEAMSKALGLLQGGGCSVEDFTAWSKIREKEIAAAAAPPVGKLSCKMSDKGCVSLYGLNAKWPVSLYPEQWERLLGYAAEIRKFSADNAAELTKRGAASKAAKAAEKAAA